MPFRNMLFLLSAVFLSAFAMSVGYAQSIDEATFRQMSKIAPGGAVTFHDLDGRTIGFAQFIEAVDGGSLFEKTVSANTGTTEIRLQPFNEAAFRTLYGIDADIALHLFDADGNTIDFAQLASAVASGTYFDRSVSKDSGAVEVRLQRLDEAVFRNKAGIAPDIALSFYDLEDREIEFSRFADLLMKKRLSFSKQSTERNAVMKIQLQEPTKDLHADTHATSGTTLSEAAMTRVRQALGDVVDTDARPILLSFYFAECGPCIAEVPALNALAKQYADIRMLAITFDDVQTSAEFKRKHAFDWQVISEAQDIIDALGVKTYPTLALLSPDGTLKMRSTVVHDGTDESARQAIRAWIDSALAVPDA